MMERRCLAGAVPTGAGSGAPVAACAAARGGSWALAGQGGFAGLRAEVRSSNPGALDFYRALGFGLECRGRYGLPWWGQVYVLHRDIAP